MPLLHSVCFEPSTAADEIFSQRVARMRHIGLARTFIAVASALLLAASAGWRGIRVLQRDENHC